MLRGNSFSEADPLMEETKVTLLRPLRGCRDFVSECTSLYRARALQGQGVGDAPFP